MQVLRATLIAFLFALVAPSAQAAVIVNVVESGGMTTFTGSGNFDLDAWSQFANDTSVGNVDASINILLGPPTGSAVATDLRFNLVTGGSFIGPTSIGSGSGGAAPASSMGQAFGLRFGGVDAPQIHVPDAYTDESALSGSMTYNVGLDVLGLDVGTHMWTWTWDDGGGNSGTDSFTLNVVPEPTTAALTALGLIGLAARRRRP